MRNLLQDVRYATRQFYKSPGFVVGAIVSLMLGIGATTTVFSVVYGVLLTPFPYKDANRIVYVRVSDKSGGFSELRVNGSQFEAIRKVSSVEDAFFQRVESKTLTSENYPIVLNAGFYSPNAFDFLGVPPLLGRVFTRADAPQGNPALVAVLSYHFWQEHYFKSHEVIGKIIQLDQVPYTVIGVMPPRFTWLDSDVYLLGAPTGDPDPFWMAFPKLKPGANHYAVEAEFQALVGALAKEPLYSYQETPRVKVVSLYDDALGSAGGAVANLFAAAVVLLIIACANVSILLLARGAARQHELAVRTSLGAGRGRLIRQLLTESVLLSVTATTLGVLAAWWGVNAARKMLPYASVPSEVAVQLNLPVLLFSAVVAVITGVLFGLSPAFELSRPHVGSVLQAGSARVAGSLRARKMHRLLIAGQVALSLLLLAGAGAAAKAFLAKVHSLQGFDPDHVFSMPVHLPIKAMTKHADLEEVRPEGIQELITEQETVRSAIAQAPGVAEAGLSPLWYPGIIAMNHKIEIKSKPTVTDAQAVIAPISPQLLSVLRIPLSRGRIFDGLEVQRQAHVAVVNQAFLKQYLGGVDPIGQRVRVPVLNYLYSSLSADDWMEVIGVVGDATNDNLEHPQVRPAVFVPSSFSNLVPGVTIYVRASGDPETAIRSVKARLRELNPDVVVVYARTLQSDLSWEWARERLITTILSPYGGIALILAATGLYSVVSFTVTQRTQELGIRIALGAGRGSVAGLVLSSTAAMLGLGVLGGLILSASLSPLVSTWGAGHLSQPLTLLEAALILVLVAVIACVVPAWRATSIDPIKVLRTE